MIGRFVSESTIILNQDSPGNIIFIVVVFVIAFGVFVRFMQKVY